MRFLFTAFLALTAFAVVAQAQIPQQFIWKITFVSNKVGNSKISVQNRCRQNHDFQITGRNVPFLDFAKDQVNVRGVGSENVPVIVNTKGLTRRSYQGQVTLFCLTCRNESGCSQSRDILNVTLNIVSQKQLADYKPSKEIGIDSPIAITASASAASRGNSGSSEADIRKLLEDLADSPASNSIPGSVAVSSCGIPEVATSAAASSKDCKGECAERQKAMRELEKRVREQTAMAQKYCLGLMQLENTTAFVEARSKRAERQLERASKNGSDERVMTSLRTEAENSRKDARVFREKVTSARRIADGAKAEAFSLMEEYNEAVSGFEDCVKKNPPDCD